MLCSTDSLTEVGRDSASIDVEGKSLPDSAPGTSVETGGTCIPDSACVPLSSIPKFGGDDHDPPG